MRLSIVAVAVLGVAFGCAPATEQPGSSRQAIIGGLAGSIGEHPTTVAVLNTGLCTGTLITPNLVLTAAHCVHPQILGYPSQAAVTTNTSVVLDSADAFESGGTSVGLAETIPHPGFAAIGDNDIALIRLAQDVTDRRPSPINRIRNDALPGVVVTQVGYGVSEVGVQGSAGELNILPNKTTISCAGVGSDTNLICFSQNDGTGKCGGDSGGPSFATINGVERVLGVTSFGDETCTLFGADTRVDAELEFLFTHAPELQCQADGACNEACGAGGLPEDRDCVRCASDADCGDDVCADGRCVAAPFAPGGLGSDCAKDADCDLSLCANSGDGGTCTQECDPAGSDCPDGFECTNAGSRDVCWPTRGGCQIGVSGLPGPGGLALFLAVLLALARRRVA